MQNNAKMQKIQKPQNHYTNEEFSTKSKKNGKRKYLCFVY